MQRFLIAALAALTSFTPVIAVADGAGSHSYTARQVEFKALTGGIVPLALTSTAKPPIASAVTSRARMGTQRLVHVDGVLLEIDEVFLRGQIDAGVFVVVYPGTGIPWAPDDDRHPRYPPDWF